jgi:putative ABC transport system permease protein
MAVYGLGAGALIALLLAAAGIYSLMSYSVKQRAHEIGLRLALGARPWHVIRLVVGGGMRLVLIGNAIGLVAAWTLTRLLARLLFGVSAHDPATLVAIVFLLNGAALLACYAPARRATKVDPMTVLRSG